MKILYLYAELMGYQIPVLREYVQKYNSDVYVVHKIKGKFTPYQPPEIKGVHYYDKDSFTRNQLTDFALNLKPDIVYVSGWMSKYLKTIFILRKKGIPVVTMVDDIWFKTIRQRVAEVVFPFIRPFIFSHAWVAGPYQYEFAKRIGFKNNEIIFNALTADTRLFNRVYSDSIIDKKVNYPHKFLFTGRFETIKGVDILIQAWSNIKARGESKDWDLTLIGNGSLYESLSNVSGVKVINFLQPDELAIEIKKYGCFVLPSRKEPWALVLHEFSAAGLPIICSDVCGASPVFVVPNYNGYIFRPNDIEDLEKQMLKIIKASDTELLAIANKSHSIGQKITPELSAASFISILNN